MKTILVILTRLYVEKNSKNDEFLAYLKYPNNENDHLIELDKIIILILHGHNKRFYSTDSFNELVDAVKSIIGEKHAYLLYHLGNELNIPELTLDNVQTSYNPFIDSLPYSIGGVGEARKTGNLITALYTSINEVVATPNNDKNLILHSAKLLKAFNNDTTEDMLFKIIDSIFNLPTKKNLEEVLKLMQECRKTNKIIFKKTPIKEYLEKNYFDIEAMRDVAIYIKKTVFNLI